MPLTIDITAVLVPNVKFFIENQKSLLSVQSAQKKKS